MISQNGLYTTIIEAIQIVTGVDIYQNKSSSPKVVDAKWLFIKVVYYLFDNPNEKITHLTKPT